MDRETIHQFAEEDIIPRLQSSPKFASAVNLREQYFHACNILHTQQQPDVPYSVIGQPFCVDKAIGRWHDKQYIHQAIAHRSNGRPPILSAEEHEDLVTQICKASAGNRPWTMTEILCHIVD
jgi:hypothetical protein